MATTHHDKLLKLIEQIMFLDMKIRTEQPSSKEKYKIYQSATILIKEAKHELQELIGAIKSIKKPIEQSNKDTMSTQHDRTMLRLLNTIESGGSLPTKSSSNTHTMLKLQEILPIVYEFQKMHENLPTRVELFNDMENDVMYEDAESYVPEENQ